LSLTPIFDAVLADSEPDIFLAGLIFPRPVTETLREALGRIGHPQFAKGGMIHKPVSPWPDLKGRFDFLTGAFVPNAA